MRDTLSYLDEERRRTKRRFIGAGVLLAAGALWVVLGESISELLSGEDNWAGEHVVVERAPSRLGEVDLRAVHELLIGEWVVARAWSHRQGPGPEQEAWAELRDAVVSDRNLLQLVEGWRSLSEDPTANAQGLVASGDQWSDYLDGQGAPWRVEAGVLLSGPDPFFYVKVYEVLADGQLTVGGAPQRMRLMRRADSLNVVEGWLGHATADPQQGGLLVVDRIVEFAADRLWMVLDPQGDPELDPFLAAFAPAVRAEAAGALSPDSFALLSDTAEARRRMVQAAEAVNSRAGCSEFQVRGLPWQGFDEQVRQQLRRAARSSLGERCPAVTSQEADDLVDTSTRLRRTQGLDQAVAELSGWVARATAAHEARHVADAADVALDHDRVTAELSAYLASFATPGLSSVAYFQACVANQDAGGVHAIAMTRSGLDCQGVPPDLVQRASAIALAEFGWGAPVQLPEDFARSLPLRE